MTDDKIDRRKSPEHREHLRRVGFQKGREKTGGRTPVPDVIKEGLRSLTPDAIATLYECLYSEKDAVRLAAAQTILSPFVAKAARKVEVEVNHDLSELHRRVTSGETNTIDIIPNNNLIERENEEDIEPIEDEYDGYSRDK
ncbi:hypothetical protein A6U96_14045 [Agrobacterium tumefaciens]|nr:hypothetical protein A6U96_14045 [Agrobacterium tumefaciens]